MCIRDRKRVQQEHGTSVILITHNMGIVAEACDDVAVMYMGRVVEYGTLEQVFNSPLHPYTRALMRSVPVLGIGKDKKLESIKGSTPDASIEFHHCEFAERCDHCSEQCLSGLPQDRILPDGHCVRCFLYAKEGEAND
jgi:oligopeptide/dipeptide ABC transporter ATP-binding protein